jgi:hypothetical protein
MEEPLALEGIRAVAKSIAPDQVIANLVVDTATIEYGDPITLTGTFTIKDKSPLAGVTVKIEGKSPGDATWRTLTTAVTDINGNITKPMLIGKATSIRATTEGTWERNDGLSNEVAISVSRLLIISAPATVKRGETLTVTGSLRPRTAGTFMTLESLVAGKWLPIGSAVPTDALGNFIFAVPAQSKGALTLRISAAAENLYPLATSPQFSILVRAGVIPELVK